MFDSSDYPKALDEAVFDDWLAKGRMSKIGYYYLLIIWNELEAEYQPVYAESRDIIREYELYKQSTTHESLIAVYDLYSESRINEST